MDDFSLADALVDDVPGQTSKTGNINKNKSAGSASQATNTSWPGAAPAIPQFTPSSGGTSQPSAPSFPNVPTSSGDYLCGPGAPGQYPPGGYPPDSQYPHGSGAPGQCPPYPNHYPAGGNALPGRSNIPYPSGPTLPYPSGPGLYSSAPGVPLGPFPNMPYPGGAPAAPYGPGAPGSFPPAPDSSSFPGFPGGAYPPIPSGTWGPPGPFPAQPNHPGSFGPGSMGAYLNPSFGGQTAPGGMLDVPYHLPLHAGVMPRLLITVLGEPTSSANRFHVDFVKGADTVFHFNPRFNEQTIVRNANLGGRWGPEEREGPFPFVQGRRFELKILVEKDMFKVAMDGTHLLEFEHRVGGLWEVTLMRVEGDVLLYTVVPSMI